jgi:HEPN domain-containing protein
MKALSSLRSELLNVHQALIESVRADYEREHGATPPGQFLQALLGDPSYAWLGPLTSLVARLDEVIDDETLQARYLDALQRHPEVLVAHGKLVRALSTA